jgi:hypothetical protein
MPLSRVTNPFLSSSGAGNVSITSPAANTIAFTTSGTEDMRIHSDGRVSVNAVATFDAGTTMVVGGGSATVRSTSAQLAIARTTSSTHYEGINLNAGPSRACFIGRPPNSDDLILGWDAGSALVEGLRFPSPGGGIKFPATQVASADANTLDDYEEGTWTPSVGGNATYGTRIATYTKIGDTVRAFFDISIGTIGTGSLTTMSGFPFTCTNNDSGCISYFSGIGATVYFIQIQMSGTNCIFVGLTAAGATINNGMNVFTTGARIIGTVVYKTTT